MEPVVSASSDLDQFLEFLYDGLEGYVYLAAKDPNDPKKWMQEFFEWPTARPTLANAIRTASASHEIYIAPALFNEPTDAQRSNVKATNVVWTDFDGNAPDTSAFGSEPSLIVQSSSESNQHVYWRLNEPLTDVDTIEDLNRRIAYNYLADLSAWDAVQVLRPPETFNHKRQTSVGLKLFNQTSFDTDIFDSLAPAPKEVVDYQWEINSLPDVQDVILKYPFGPDLVQLLKKDRNEVGDRSVSLMNLAYGCCELGMKDVEVFVVLRLADDRWEKFKNRKDRDKQLSRIISRARTKYPEDKNLEVLPVGTDEEDDNPFFIWDYSQFLEAEIEIDWLIEGMLMEGGNMLMAGPSGIGKTQLTLQFMKHIALGKNFLHYNIPQAKKVLFLSLEMGHPDLQVFMRKQDADLTDAERALLAQNLHIIPYGESWPLNTPHGQDQLKVVLDALQPEVLFVDSIGSAIIGNINNSDVVQPFTNFNDHIRKRYGLTLWYIHHTRKAGPGQNGRVDQDDIYGDQYLVNRCTSAYGVLRGKDGTIKIRNFKSRLSAIEDDYLIERTPNLNFEKVNQSIDENIKLKNQLVTKSEEHTETINDITPGGFTI